MEQQKKTASKRELLVLLVIYLIGFAGLAIHPYDRTDWVLENLFPLSQLIALIVVYPYFKFTRLSYYLIFFYLFVQTWGGHFTYAEAAPFNWYVTIIISCATTTTELRISCWAFCWQFR